MGVGLGLILMVAAAIGVISGFYYWARRQARPAGEPAISEQHGKRRVSLLTEAMAYVGAVLLVAGGITALGQRWGDISAWGHVGVFAAAAAFFLLIGLTVRQVSEPAIQRMVGVVWLLSVVGAGGAAGFAAGEVYGASGEATLLVVGVAVSLYAAALWLVRREALQNIALFAGLVIAICGAIVTAAGEPAPQLAFALALWGFGLAWAVLGWQRYVTPTLVTMPFGVVLALIAPAFPGLFLPGQGGGQGWVFAIGIPTAAAIMAVSVPLRNTMLLGLGTVAMFGYVTAAVVRYFRESLGIPAALAITGVLVIGLAVVTARLLRAARPPKRARPAAPRQRRKPPSHHGLPRAS